MNKEKAIWTTLTIKVETHKALYAYKEKHLHNCSMDNAILELLKKGE